MKERKVRWATDRKQVDVESTNHRSTVLAAETIAILREQWMKRTRVQFEAHDCISKRRRTPGHGRTMKMRLWHGHLETWKAQRQDDYIHVFRIM
jgi:hypothetical protein